jgi:uncharacterized membrane protein
LPALLIAIALTVADLGAKSLWLDEGFTVVLIRLGWHRVGEILLSEQANMSGYHAALFPWVRLVGTSETAVRSLSAAFAVLCVPVVYGLASLMKGRAYGLIASVLFALNAFFVQYAQEARAYSMVLLFSTLSSYFFVKALADSSPRRWIAYVVTSVVALYAHIFAALVIAAQALFLLWRRSRVVAPMRAAILSFGAIVLLASPLLLFMSREGHLEWLAPPTWRTVLTVLEMLSGSGGRGLLAVYGVLCCLALVAASRQPSENWAIEFLMIWLVLPFAVTIPFSLAVKPIFVARYLIICLPPLALLSASGLLAIPTRPVQAVVGAIVCALAARSCVWYYRTPKEGWREATGYVQARSQPGDGIVFDPPYVRLPVEYYVRRLGAESRAPLPIFPPEPWGQIDPVTPEFSETVDEWARTHGPLPPRLWVMSRGDGQPLTGIPALVQRAEQRFPGVTLRLFSTTGP